MLPLSTFGDTSDSSNGTMYSYCYCFFWSMSQTLCTRKHEEAGSWHVGKVENFSFVHSYTFFLLFYFLFFLMVFTVVDYIPFFLYVLNTVDKNCSCPMMSTLCYDCKIIDFSDFSVFPLFVFFFGLCFCYCANISAFHHFIQFWFYFIFWQFNFFSFLFRTTTSCMRTFVPIVACTTYSKLIFLVTLVWPKMWSE